MNSYQLLKVCGCVICNMRLVIIYYPKIPYNVEKSSAAERVSDSYKMQNCKSVKSVYLVEVASTLAVICFFCFKVKFASMEAY